MNTLQNNYKGIKKQNIKFEFSKATKIALMDFFHMSGAIMLIMGIICGYHGQILFCLLGIIGGSFYCLIREENEQK